MIVKQKKAWFIARDGRAPQTLYIMYDWENCGSQINFMTSKLLDLNENSIPLIFNAESEKWNQLEHILKWDFLPNSTGIPLANAKALALLEELAHGDFEAIPTEIRMPDGHIIHDYKLINILNKVLDHDGIDFEKSILKLEKDRVEWDQYNKLYYKPDCLGDKNLGVCKLLFLGSSILKHALKDKKITGLVLKNSYGATEFAED